MLSLFILSCEIKPFTGYIVAKEYVEGHMCHDDDYYHTVESSFVIAPHVPHTPHHHTWQEAKFIIYVANKDDVRPIHVDSLAFIEYKITDKVTVP
jgi:hypothetical protein